MIRKLISTTFLFLFVFSAVSYAQVKIGHMNSQQVLSEMPERPEVEQQLNSFIQEKQQEFQQRTTSFQESVADFQQNQDNMSESEVQQRQQELAETEASLQEYQQQIQQQIQQRRSSLLQPLYDKMDEGIAVVAEEMDLDFVLNEATNSGENVIYYSASEQMDITQQVLEQIK